jgi:PHP family Zn ribbon phosphoesterase
VDLGFKVWPPLLKRAAGRPMVQRIRGCFEVNATKRRVKCRRCGGFGHFTKSCKDRMEELNDPEEQDDQQDEAATPNKRFP